MSFTFFVAGLEKDLNEASKFRDDLRTEAKDWEKKFQGMQKERLKELADTRRVLKEKQELYGSIDTYLLRSGGSRTMTSSASTVSMEHSGYEKVTKSTNAKVTQFLPLLLGCPIDTNLSQTIYYIFDIKDKKTALHSVTCQLSSFLIDQSSCFASLTKSMSRATIVSSDTTWCIMPLKCPQGMFVHTILI